MMTKTDSTRPVQDDLFRVMLNDLVAKNAPYKRKKHASQHALSPSCN